MPLELGQVDPWSCTSHTLVSGGCPLLHPSVTGGCPLLHPRVTGGCSLLHPSIKGGCPQSHRLFSEVANSNTVTLFLVVLLAIARCYSIFLVAVRC